MDEVTFSLKPIRLSASLPAFPCTEELKQQIVAIAKAESVSVAQVERTAMMFFVQHFKSSVVAPQAGATDT